MENTSQSGLTLYYFRANWCHTCGSFDPTYNRVTALNIHPIKTIVIDIDQDKKLVSRFNITSVPTVVVAKDGEELEKQVGQLSTNRLKALMSKYV